MCILVLSHVITWKIESYKSSLHFILNSHVIFELDLTIIAVYPTMIFFCPEIWIWFTKL